MKNYLVLTVFAIFALVLQTTLLNEIAIAGVKPDLILILAIFVGIICGPGKGGMIGFSLGLLEDLYLGSFIGMNALSKGVTAVLVGRITIGAFSENLLVPIITVFIGTLLNNIIYLITGAILGMNWGLELWLWNAVPLAIYNMCLVPFIYPKFYSFGLQLNEKHANAEFWERFS